MCTLNIYSFSCVNYTFKKWSCFFFFGLVFVFALAVWLSWLEYYLVHRKIAGSNPGQSIPRLLEHIPGFDPRSGHVVLLVCFEKETTIRMLQSIELADEDFKAVCWPVWLRWLERRPIKLRVPGLVDVFLSL